MEFLSLGKPVILAEELEVAAKQGKYTAMFVDEKLFESLEQYYSFIEVHASPVHQSVFELQSY